MTSRFLSQLSRIPATAMVAILFVIVVVIFAFVARGFWSPNNLTTILATTSVLMIVALGQLLVVISGGFDLSVGGLVPLSAVLFATFTTAGMPAYAAAGIAILAGAAVGALHTLFIVVMGVNPLITTLASLSITGGIAFTIAGGQTVSVPTEAGILGNRAIGSIPWFVLLMAVLAVIMHIVLQNTAFGRRIYMVGGNKEAARLAGVRTIAVGGSVYLISGVLACVAGVALASQLLSASGSVGTTVTLQSLAAVVLGGAALTGGRGSVPGAVIGVLFLGVIANGLNILRVPTFYQQVVTGIVLLLAVTLSWIQEHPRTRS